jgi:hypothetical protein
MFQINLIAPPLYVVTTNTLERVEGLAKLQQILDVIKSMIEASGGVFTVKMAVSCVLILVFNGNTDLTVPCYETQLHHMHCSSSLLAFLLLDMVTCKNS